MKYCTECGAQINDKAVICPKCGCPTKAYRKSSSITFEKMIILYAVCVLASLITGVIKGTLGDSSNYVSMTISLITINPIMVSLFIIMTSMILFLNYKTQQKNVSIMFIIMGALIFIAFGVAANYVKLLGESLNSYSKSRSAYDAVEPLQKALTIEVFAMISYLLSSIFAVLIGILGFSGKFQKSKQAKVVATRVPLEEGEEYDDEVQIEA